MAIALQILIFGYIGTIAVILVAAIAIERKGKIWDAKNANVLETNLARFRQMQRDFRGIDDLKFLLDTRFPISFCAKRLDERLELQDTLKIVRETKRRLEGKREA